MKIFYVTLVKKLSGYCIKARANDEFSLRKYLSKNYGSLRFTVYDHKPTEQLMGHILYVGEEE